MIMKAYDMVIKTVLGETFRALNDSPEWKLKIKKVTLFQEARGKKYSKINPKKVEQNMIRN